MAITIKDIARMSGVSTTTVSKIINNKDKDISFNTRERVNKIISENNYSPNNIARSMVTKKSRTIGLIIPDVRNPFFTDLVRGVEDVAEAMEYNVFFCNTDEKLDKELKSINTMSEKMVEGIVIVPSVLRDKVRENNLNIKIPMVTIDRSAYYNNIVGSVRTDNYVGAYEAIKYLIENGHKKIAFISGPIDILPSIERKQGFIDACINYGIEVSDEDIYIGEFDINWGEEVTKKINSNYTALFCGNDLIAAGVVRGLIKKGINIPKDVSVVGFDDISLATYIHPELTTVRQDSYKIGSEATKILLDFIENKKNKSKLNHIILKSKFILRESTGKAGSCE